MAKVSGSSREPDIEDDGDYTVYPPLSAKEGSDVAACGGDEEQPVQKTATHRDR